MEYAEETSTGNVGVSFDFGTFEGFNFREQSAIERILSTDEVLNWDHDQDGEAEFWPSGDNAEVALIFKGQTAVCCSELVALDRLLSDLGGDSTENYLRIYAKQSEGSRLEDLTAALIEDEAPNIYIGTSFTQLRQDAAYELFELYYPEAYRVWEQGTCDGLIFDTDVFLDSPGFSVDEVKLGDQAVLLVRPQ